MDSMDSKKTCQNCLLTSDRKAPKLSPFHDWIVAKKMPPKIPQPTRVQELWGPPPRMPERLACPADRLLAKVTGGYPIDVVGSKSQESVRPFVD